MKNKRALLTGWFLLIVCLVCIFNAFAHSGRTDSSGGHRDNSNESGLGNYHYHCGGNPPHLHTNGICPYESDAYSSNQQSSYNWRQSARNILEQRESENTQSTDDWRKSAQNILDSRGYVDPRYQTYEPNISDDYNDGYDIGYDEGHSVGYDEGYEEGYNFRVEEVAEGNTSALIFLFSILAIVIIVELVKFIVRRRKEGNNNE